MTNLLPFLKSIVTALFLALFSALPVAAQDDEVEVLLEQLAQPDVSNWEIIEHDIWALWSKSGSDAMDLLLERGQKAIEDGEYGKAIEHLTALTDHAPDFAEGWNARATAYFHAGLYGPSIEDIRRTLILNPRHFGALTGLGMILEEMQLPDDALYAFRQAQILHPHRPSIQENVTRLEQRVTGTDL